MSRARGGIPRDSPVAIATRASFRSPSVFRDPTSAILALIVQPGLIVGAGGAGFNRLQDPGCFPGALKGNTGSREHLRRGWRPSELEGRPGQQGQQVCGARLRQARALRHLNQECRATLARKSVPSEPARASVPIHA